MTSEGVTDYDFYYLGYDKEVNTSYFNKIINLLLIITVNSIGRPWLGTFTYAIRYTWKNTQKTNFLWLNKSIPKDKISQVTI